MPPNRVTPLKRIGLPHIEPSFGLMIAQSGKRRRVCYRTAAALISKTSRHTATYSEAFRRALMSSGRKPGILHSLEFDLVEIDSGIAVFAGTPGERTPTIRSAPSKAATLRRCLTPHADAPFTRD